MMMSEFIERTGFEPTASEYAKIEEAYYDFNGNKDEFCKAFASLAPSTACPCTRPPIGTTSALTAPASCMSLSTANSASTAAK